MPLSSHNGKLVHNLAGNPMKKVAIATLLASLAVLAGGPAFAAEPASKPTAKPAPDKSVGSVLDSLKYHYEVDNDGDYRMTFDMDNDRTQLVFVRSPVETYGSFHIREIWSPAYKAPNGKFPADVAVRLLEDSNDSKMGGWVKQGDIAMFVVKIDANANADQLSDAIDAAIKSADGMEKELTSKDDF